MSLARRRFASKDAARQAVWTSLVEQGAARFPFPVEGRIPNFKGAEQAAERLLDHPLFRNVRRIKVNPDSPQRPLRLAALRRGITLLVPTPRLAGGFRLYDPREIPPEHLADAATLSRGGPWAREVPADELPPVDLIVTGSVAVTAAGKRCGKGHGYGDLEYAVLRELGYPEVPVVTSVHELQVVGDFPTEAHDLPVWVIATPAAVLEVDQPPPAPSGVDWKLLTDEDIARMPALAPLRARRTEDAPP